MIGVRLWLAGLVLALVGASAFALEQCTQYTWANDGSFWYDSEAASLQGWQASMGSTTCTRSNFRTVGGYHKYDYQCGCCESGTSQTQVYTRTGAYCSACTVPEGTEQTRNVTYGYAGKPPVPGGTAYLDYLPSGAPNTGGAIPNPPSQPCIDKCVFDVQGEGDIWASTVASDNGLYRVSRDVRYKSKGLECSMSEGERRQFDIGSAPPACQGSMGYVNGKKVCLPSVPDSGLKWPTGAYKEGNPKAGSEPTQGERIPPTGGNGGNGGGPAGLRDGVTVFPGGIILEPTQTTPPTGTKTTVSGEEQVACGAPGQPKCAIDETGTPSSREIKLDEVSINTQAQTNRNTVGGTSDKGMFASWGNLFVTPSVGSCTALQLPDRMAQAGINVDPCPVVDGARTIMGFAWALGAFWLCLGWIREAV